MRSILFLFLLPLFFVFHGYVENYRNIQPLSCIPLVAVYLAVTAIVYGACRLLLKTPLKAALLAAFIMSFFFFFGALHDFLRVHHIFLQKYSLILPAFTLTAVLLTWRLRKKTPSPKLPRYLNILLTVYIIVDLVTLLAGAGGKGAQKISAYPQPDGAYRRCDTCARPDIYFILFDEYSNSRTLSQTFHFDNSRFDDWLTGHGFHLLPESRSNYPKTPFSMASILNFSYVGDIGDTANVKAHDFSNQLVAIRENEVCRFLTMNGYQIVNNSIFDLAGAPSTVNLTLIPARTRLITERTLLNYLARDLGGWFTAHFSHVPTESPEAYYAHYDGMNRQLLRQTIEESARTAPQPRFVYTHILMPHGPYLTDSLGHPRDARTVATENQFSSLNAYLQYIPPANTVIEDLLTRIRRNTHDQAVIIFMSDHGFRYAAPPGTDPDKADPAHSYDNQNAIFLPTGDYRGFYPAISAVNEFRALFDNLYRQQLPMLPDSAVRLHITDEPDW